MGLKILLAASTSWPANARIAGGLKQFGCEVDILAPSEAPVRESRYVSLRNTYRALSPLTSLRDAFSISRPDLVIPCDDRMVQHLLRLRELEPQASHAKVIELSLGAPDQFAKMMSRERFMAEADAAGIAVPKTIPLASESALDAALDTIGLPAVLKADGSWGGDGVAIVHNREDARAAFRRLSQPVSPLRSIARAVLRSDAHHLQAAMKPLAPVISIQSFIPGSPATTAFACWKGEVQAMIHTDVVAGNGATGPATVIRRADCADMDGAARRIARRFSLSGLHGLDFIRNAQGKVFLLEINPRATQTSYLSFGPGRDLLSALVAQASGHACAPRQPATSNPVIALFPQEWTRDANSPHLKSAFHDIPWDDPDVMRSWLARVPLKTLVASHTASIPPKRTVYGLETLAS